jgi:hypothetical protein
LIQFWASISFITEGEGAGMECALEKTQPRSSTGYSVRRDIVSVNRIQVHVTLEEQTGHLSVDTSQLDLYFHDEVHWIFPVTEPRLLPHIFFPTGESYNSQKFGPFQYLEPSSLGVRALGNTGFAGSYAYVLMLLNGDRAVAASDQLVIHNHATVPDMSPDATVQYEPPRDPESQPSLLVTPNPLSLEVMRTVNWHVKGIPAGQFVTFRFDDERPAKDTFLSFSMTRGVGDCWRATGTNFLFDIGSDPLPASISYHLTLRDSEGTKIISHDPVIEPLAIPPIPPTEE